MRWVVLFLILSYKLFALPGDVLYSDDFERTNLAPWTTTETTRSGIGTHTSNSPTSSMYTRHDVVTVISPTINLSVPGAKLEMWIRRGSDSFSEDPDTNEDLVVEYQDSSGVWHEIASYLGDGTPGEVYNLSYQLPNNALYNNFQLRIRQTGGSGTNWDYWHIDDVVITETGYVAPPPPLKVGQCDEFEGDLSNWTVSDSFRVNITTATANSPTRSLSIHGGNVDATSITMDTSSNFDSLTVWIRRGSDTFSEDPDPGEDLVVEYLNSSNNWIALETFLGSGIDGQIYNRTYSMPADAKHPNFQIRFRMTNGSGNNWDYWHVDDVCLIPETYMTSSKSSCVVSDPVNNTVNPKRIPGAMVRYAIEIENITDFETSNNLVTDTIDSNLDDSTISNIGIADGACNCQNPGTTSPNGANGGVSGSTVTLDFGTVDPNTKECGYFEVDIK